ncbi:ABC transporter ATP-binding protein [Chondrinema litorale]|uniref:ABC transporter ATP-binding protein n=1 Tax=Chondrinema litorale TaxID=2994555 RepID=UPI002542F9A2|nr:ABC transporter ATP-binding protein [Chondrinema litorale]UZR99782.1 ABC transporter ATP-binding protein [Chondrinema litorale]
MSSSKEKILQTKNLSIGYQEKILLSSLNLELERGELTCLLGPNGTGKSTLLHTLTSMLKPVSGEVYIQGKLLEKQNPAELAHLIGIVLSQKLSPVNLSVYDIVALGRTPYTNWLGHLSDKDKEAIYMAMELVEVTKFAGRSINKLSDGERQRVMIAKALAQDTPLVVLDEPTAHLDVNNRVSLISLLKELARETNKAILLSTHELEMAIQLADSVWLITNNQELKSGSPEDLVLTGIMADTFKGKSIAFDMHSGAFKILHKTNKTVNLRSNGIPGYWTKHALEKEGFQITDEANAAISISMNEELPYSWKVQHNQSEVEVNCISDLKKTLRSATR